MASKARSMHSHLVGALTIIHHLVLRPLFSLLFSEMAPTTLFALKLATKLCNKLGRAFPEMSYSGEA
jgi:hypothetical protein